MKKKIRLLWLLPKGQFSIVNRVKCPISTLSARINPGIFVKLIGYFYWRGVTVNSTIGNTVSILNPIKDQFCLTCIYK